MSLQVDVLQNILNIKNHEDARESAKNILVLAGFSNKSIVREIPLIMDNVCAIRFKVRTEEGKWGFYQLNVGINGSQEFYYRLLQFPSWDSKSWDSVDTGVDVAEPLTEDAQAWLEEHKTNHGL